MGCDIHAHVELKLADGQWHHGAFRSQYLHGYHLCGRRRAAVG